MKLVTNLFVALLAAALIIFKHDNAPLALFIFTGVIFNCGVVVGRFLQENGK
jgi:lipopolysaccharide export LptBFGC system permease protein LptF